MSRQEQVLTIRIGAQVGQALQGINRIGERVQRFGKDVQRTGRTLSRNLTGPLVAVGAAATAAAIRMGNSADKLLDLEQSTGLTTDALQEFRRVATVAGVDQDTIADAAERLTRRLKAAGKESASTRAALERLGVSTRDSTGQVRDMDELLPELITSLQQMENVTERNSLATEVFGRGAANIAPVLGMSADAFERTRKEARDMGLVLDRDALEAANEFRVGWDTLTERLRFMASEVGVAVIPVVTQMVDLFQDRVVPVLQAAVDWLGRVDSRWLAVGAAVGGLLASIGPFLAVMGKVIAVFGLVLSPAGLVIAAVALIGAAVVTLVRNWDRFLLFWVGLWQSIQERVFDGVRSVLGALAELTSAIPGLRDVVGLAQKGFEEFATRALAGTSRAVQELETRLASSRDEMADADAATRDLTDQVEALGIEGVQTGGVLNQLGDTSRDLTARLGEVELGVVGVDNAMAQVPATVGRMEANATLSLSNVSQRLRETAGAGTEAFESFRDAASQGLTDVQNTMRDVARQGEQAFVDFTFGATRAIRDFVSNALRELARMVASRVFRLAFSALTGGFGGGLLGSFGGFFQEGGVLRPGRFGIAGEGGQAELITAGAAPVRITPFHDLAAGGGASRGSGDPVRDALRSMPPMPEMGPPEIIATHQWYRRLIDTLLNDARRRGSL